VAALGNRNVLVSFGIAYSIAAITVALVDAVTVVIPGLEEGAEHILGPAWLYMGVVGIIVLAGLGCAGVARGQSKRRTAFIVMTSTVVSGLAIASLAAYAGSSGSN
jgi:hypothetical protein